MSLPERSFPRLWCLALMALLTGCQAVWGFKDFKGTGGSGGGGNGGSGGAQPCTDSKAPAGTVGVRLSSGKCVWMDALEVKAGDYQAFANDISDPSPYTDTPCQWKTSKASFQPGCASDASTGSSDPNLPATCVDWCDARAYCRSVGEHLCGDPNDTAHSWWQTACTSGSQYSYPYGATYNAQFCNGADNPGHGCGSGCVLADVGSQPKCVTPSGIFDLSGNASEWVNECDGYSTQTEGCAVRGGSVQNKGNDIACQSLTTPARSTRTPFIGFRCCWTPP